MLNFLIAKVYAAESTIPPQPYNFLSNITTLGCLFSWITNGIVVLGMGLVIVFLALGFIKFITSQGDKLATETAQKWVTYAVLGGVGLFAIYAIKAILLKLLGATDLLTC